MLDRDLPGHQLSNSVTKSLPNSVAKLVEWELETFAMSHNSPSATGQNTAKPEK